MKSSMLIALNKPFPRQNVGVNRSIHVNIDWTVMRLGFGFFGSSASMIKIEHAIGPERLLSKMSATSLGYDKKVRNNLFLLTSHSDQKSTGNDKYITGACRFECERHTICKTGKGWAEQEQNCCNT